MTEVKIISAAWCKRCHTIKPDIEAMCKAADALLTVVDYEEMEETDKAAIKSLPTICMRLGPQQAWVSYTANTLEEWKTALATASLATASLGQIPDTDF